MERVFHLNARFKPAGDQPQAIEQLVKNLKKGAKWQVLLGVTGSGKTFTMANVIEQLQKPVLVISHNKTLAAQLYGEFREFFPENKVRYFVSYYDYYQPEAYIPATDTYIEKDASINQDIDRLRLATTSSILSSRDVIVVASVSSIYPLGSPEDHKQLAVNLIINQKIGRIDILRRLVEIQYERNDFELERGRFRARGNTIELIPSYEEMGVRIILDSEKIIAIERFNPITGKTIAEEESISIYPAKHFVSPSDKLKTAIQTIREELDTELEKLKKQGKLLEAERLEMRTKNDLEMLIELGYCHGIENYSRHLAGRLPGQRPECLLDYFPSDYLLFIDESHMTIPQIRGMYAGDRSRKEILVQYGFRLPSALDNRPLTFEEFENMINQVICVSATPGPYELEKIGVRNLGENSPFLVQQVIRPTGLVDPNITVLPTENQLDDLVARIKERVKKNQRTLVLTISKQLAEQLSDYLKESHIKVMYLHYEIDTLERLEILKKLRDATFDVVVGINLLREGLDLPEVSLVAILDADKEGFLRSDRSLIQIAGRASRSIDGAVIMYADRITRSMETAIVETQRRRTIQQQYNKTHDITPQPILKPIQQTIGDIIGNKKQKEKELILLEEEEYYGKDLAGTLKKLEKKMMASAKQLDFDTAIKYREKINRLKNEK